MGKIFIYVDSVEARDLFTNNLKKKGIANKQIHIMKANKLEENLQKEGFNNLLRNTDLIPSLKRGFIAGIGLAIFVHIIMIVAGIHYPLSVLISSVIFCIVFGMWTSSMIGISVENDLLHEVNTKIAEGKNVMVVIYKNGKEKVIIQNMVDLFPEITISNYSK